MVETTNLVVGVPPTILELVQQGLLEREFHDGLFPSLLYRSEALEEQWEANSGTQIFMSRPGLLAPVTKPVPTGTDPTPKVLNYEQWIATLQRYGDSIDTDIPTSAVASSNQFLRNVKQLGLQAGQSLNRIPRNAIFKAYLSGSTNCIAAAAAGDAQIRVAALNGFTDVVVLGSNVAPRPVSASYPLAISITGVVGTRNVIQATPDNPDDPYGPGTLYLSAILGGAGAALRAPVLSAARPTILRAGGGDSVDSLAAADILTLQDLINASARLRKNNVLPHEDGFYHAHMSPESSAQLFVDAAVRAMLTALPNHPYFEQGLIGAIAKIAVFENVESPDLNNAGARTATGAGGAGALSMYSEDVGAETTNAAGVNVGRVLVTGRGAMYERWLDERQYVTEAGITGKVGGFTIVNQGIEVMTERIRLILRAPINRFQDKVAATWSCTTSFPIPSDVTSGGPQRYKRAIIIEHEID